MKPNATEERKYFFCIDPSRDGLAGIAIEFQSLHVSRGNDNVRLAVLSLISNSESSSSFLFLGVRQIEDSLREDLADVESFALKEISSTAGEDDLAFGEAVLDAIVKEEKGA